MLSRGSGQLSHGPPSSEVAEDVPQPLLEALAAARGARVDLPNLAGVQEVDGPGTVRPEHVGSLDRNTRDTGQRETVEPVECGRSDPDAYLVRSGQGFGDINEGELPEVPVLLESEPVHGRQSRDASQRVPAA